MSLRLVVCRSAATASAEDWLSQAWVAEGDAEAGRRDVIFDDPDKPVRAPSTGAGACRRNPPQGPAVIEEPNSTTLIHPGDEVEVTEHGHLVITLATQN